MSLREVVETCRIIFVCLPTPMRPDGSCDIRIVEDVVEEINDLCRETKLKDRIVILKSTVPPGTTSSLNEEHDDVTVVFSPEFLTEANSVDDFKNQTRIIVGGPRPASSLVKTLFRKAFPAVPIIKTSSDHAEMVKYFINCFLSSKVSFSNEMYQLCTRLGLDYDKVVEYALYDKRLGPTHFSVPGPDGSFGFGGHCFPKDLNAMITVFAERGLKSTVLQAVKEKNDEVRDDRDWEKMRGRAVSDD
tara:strand:- start:105 stop:842 length:738 start_codon:yes stop_codon:yes gene_type:complete